MGCVHVDCTGSYNGLRRQPAIHHHGCLMLQFLLRLQVHAVPVWTKCV